MFIIHAILDIVKVKYNVIKLTAKLFLATNL